MTLTVATEHIGGGWSCPSGKRSFDSHRQAKAWVRSHQSQWGAGRRRSYRCPECHLIHITKYTAAETTAIREKMARGDL